MGTAFHAQPPADQHQLWIPPFSSQERYNTAHNKTMTILRNQHCPLRIFPVDGAASSTDDDLERERRVDSLGCAAWQARTHSWTPHRVKKSSNSLTTRGPSDLSSAAPTLTAAAHRTETASVCDPGRERMDATDSASLATMGNDTQASTGHSNGVGGGGMTRPKRRLSSLTHAARPTSVASPPASPVSHGQFFPRDHHTFSRPSPPKLQIDEKAMGYMAQNQPLVYTPTGIGGSKEREREKEWEKGVNGLGGSAARGVEDAPRLFGIELKWISLITLALQNAFLTIIMHYSRIKALPSQTYSAAAAVLLNELLKGCISGCIALRRIDRELLAATQHRPLSHATTSTPASPILRMFHSTRLHQLSLAMFSADCWKLSIPAILYVIQNNLQYLAASNLDVATFQVTYQMKILTTAFFSVVMLKKRLSFGKWMALLLLAVGVGIVQLQSTSSSAHAPKPAPPLHTSSLRSIIPGEENEAEAFIPATLEAERVMHPFTGFVAVCLACMTSGLAGVYFELILKGSPAPAPPSGIPPPPKADLWVRNTQLSIFSLIPAIIPILFGDHGGSGFGRILAPFRNFNGWAFATVVTQTVGGLVTAVVIRYSDNIMKGFATSLSILISSLASVILFSYPITFGFVLGASVVLLATYLYNAPGPPARSNVAVAPGSPIPSSAPILGEPTKPSRTSSMISLLGLGATSSRRPSAADLRNGSVTPYSSSAPGTPYLGPIPPAEGLVISTHGRRSKPVAVVDAKEKRDD